MEQLNAFEALVPIDQTIDKLATIFNGHELMDGEKHDS